MARLMDPRKPDGSFPFDYKPAAQTDVRQTIEREKRRLQEQQPAQVVATIKPRVRAK